LYGDWATEFEVPLKEERWVLARWGIHAGKIQLLTNIGASMIMLLDKNLHAFRQSAKE
jgi:hypothetical protein